MSSFFLDRLRTAFSSTLPKRVVRTRGNSSVSGFIIGIAFRRLLSSGNSILSKISGLVKLKDTSSHIPMWVSASFTRSAKACKGFCPPWVTLPCVPILQMLCVWGAFLPICELYKNVVISHGKSNVYLYANILFGVVQLLVLVAMVSWGILWMVAGYVVAYFFWLFAWHGFAHRCCDIRLHELLKDIVPYLLFTVLALGAGWWVAAFFSSIYVRFLVKVLVSAMAYLLVLWQSGSVAFRESLNFLLNKG